MESAETKGFITSIDGKAKPKKRFIGLTINSKWDKGADKQAIANRIKLNLL